MGFWTEHAERLHWIEKWHTLCESDYDKAKIRWFIGGKLNACYNCVDRHVDDGHGDDTALIWEGNDPNESRTFTYAELQDEVQKAANALKDLGLAKGDRVCIYMQMIPELTIAMLACARIGVVHSIVFGAFSADSLVTRINDSECKAIITQDTGVRGTKLDIPMKANADKAVESTPSIEKILVVKRTGSGVAMANERDVWWHDALEAAEPVCAPEPMDAEDPLFILYTSGSTGKPKGVLHTTGGYLTYAATTHHYVFDYHPGDVYWCTADIGWVTGHSYIVYGPMANRAITMMFEGVPNYPDFGRFWQIVAKHKVNIFYTAPTALRLMKEGDTWPSAARPLHSDCSVPSANRSKSRNGTGTTLSLAKAADRRHMVADRDRRDPHQATPTKPGSATLPFFGVRACAFVDDKGNVIEGNGVAGNLCMLEKLARPDAARFTAISNGSSTRISRGFPANISVVTAAAAMTTATTGLPAVWTTSSSSADTTSAPPKSRALSAATRL